MHLCNGRREQKTASLAAEAAYPKHPLVLLEAPVLEEVAAAGLDGSYEQVADDAVLKRVWRLAARHAQELLTLTGSLGDRDTGLAGNPAKVIREIEQE